MHKIKHISACWARPHCEHFADKSAALLISWTTLLRQCACDEEDVNMPEGACCANAHVYSCMYRSASKLGSSSPSSSLFSFVTPLCRAMATAAQTQQVLTRRTRVTFVSHCCCDPAASVRAAKVRQAGHLCITRRLTSILLHPSSSSIGLRSMPTHWQPHPGLPAQGRQSPAAGSKPLCTCYRIATR